MGGALTVSESDNLGSTDSEVKKILTLHLPISEYDTLGSDSEGEIPGGQVAASQELVSFRHRMTRGKQHVNQLSWIIKLSYTSCNLCKILKLICRSG